MQEFGSEGSAADRAQAAAVLHSFLDARAERKWAVACRYLSSTVLHAMVGSSATHSCPLTLGALTAGVPTARLREAARADVGSLRRQGGRGFLLYRGAPSGTVYAISMSRDADVWKVASLGAVPLNSG